VSKSHDSITDELELGLELGVVFGQALLAGADGLVALVVGSAQTARVATFEVVLPKFCKKNV